MRTPAHATETHLASRISTTPAVFCILFSFCYSIVRQSLSCTHFTYDFTCVYRRLLRGFL